jgi:site-specific recombinase XerD
VRHLIVDVFTRAGIPEEFHFPHVLRHSAITQMLNSGTSPPAIQERVGHKALETTFGYMHTTDEARARVNKAFDEEESE